MIITPTFKAERGSLPGTNNNAPSINPFIVAQKTHWGTGISIFTPTVIESITNDPESERVTKTPIPKRLPN